MFAPQAHSGSQGQRFSCWHGHAIISCGQPLAYFTHPGGCSGYASIHRSVHLREQQNYELERDRRRSDTARMRWPAHDRPLALHTGPACYIHRGEGNWHTRARRTRRCHPTTARGRRNPLHRLSAPARTDARISAQPPRRDSSDWRPSERGLLPSGSSAYHSPSGSGSIPKDGPHPILAFHMQVDRTDAPASGACVYRYANRLECATSEPGSLDNC